MDNDTLVVCGTVVTLVETVVDETVVTVLLIIPILDVVPSLFILLSLPFGSVTLLRVERLGVIFDSVDFLFTIVDTICIFVAVAEQIKKLCSDTGYRYDYHRSTAGVWTFHTRSRYE